eukprot:2549315-Ditylum_brightwellii.AAC.1
MTVMHHLSPVPALIGLDAASSPPGISHCLNKSVSHIAKNSSYKMLGMQFMTNKHKCSNKISKYGNNFVFEGDYNS